jgi:hypothetical protein
LGCPDGTNCHEEFVVHSSGIEEERADDTLAPFDSRSIEWRGCVDVGGCVLFLSTVDDFSMKMWGVDGFCWRGVSVTGSYLYPFIVAGQVRAV